MTSPIPGSMTRTQLAVRLHATPPETAVSVLGPPVDQQVRLHAIAVGLLTGYRDGVLLDYTRVRHAIRHTDWVTVRVDWQQLATLADDMGGGHGLERQTAAYHDTPTGNGDHQTGVYAYAVRYVRHILAVGAGIALGEIGPDEATALTAALTAVGWAATPTRAGGGEPT